MALSGQLNQTAQTLPLASPSTAEEGSSITTESGPAFVSKPAPDGYRYAGAWIRLAALMIDGLVLFAVASHWASALALFLALAYPTVNLDMDGWPAGAVAYVVTSAGLLGWYGGWQARRRSDTWHAGAEAAGPRSERGG